MDQFLKNLFDPGWWFSGFFFAIVAVLVNGVLQEPVNRWLSSSSGWYRSRRAVTLLRREQRLELLVMEPTLLILFTVRNGIEWLFFFFSFGMFLLIPVWSDLMNSSPSFASWIFYRPLPGTDRSTGVAVIKLAIILLGVASTFMIYIAMLEGSLAGQAYKRLSDRLKTANERPQE
jgi:hypothetical protein